MKITSCAIFYMGQWQTSCEYQQYGYSEARPFQDKQKNMIRRCSC